MTGIVTSRRSRTSGPGSPTLATVRNPIGANMSFRREIFDYLKEGEELVQEPFQRLIEVRQLVAFQYGGFWASMDTFKDKQRLDDLHAKGDAPWAIWKRKEIEAKVHA